MTSGQPPKSIRAALRRLSAARATKDMTLSETFGFPLGDLLGRDPKEDRAIALMAATLVDQGLTDAIATELHLPDSDAHERIFGEPPAPLSSFHAKIEMAFALRVIGEQCRRDMRVIKDVRNVFAHTRQFLSFETPEIVAACGLISVVDRWPTILEGCANHDERELYIHFCFQASLGLICYKPSDKDRELDVIGRVLRL